MDTTIERLIPEVEYREFIFENIFQLSTDLVIVLDLNLNITLVNTSALKFLSCKNLEDILGKKIFDFISPDD